MKINARLKEIKDQSGLANLKVDSEIEGESTVFRYLGVDIDIHRGIKEEIDRRVAEDERVSSSLGKIQEKGNLSKKVKMNMFESVFVPAVL